VTRTVIITAMQPPFQPHGADDSLDAYIEVLECAHRRASQPQPVGRPALAPRPSREGDRRSRRAPARV